MSDQTRHFTYGTRKKMKGGKVYVCEWFDIVGVPVSRWRASIPGNFGRAVCMSFLYLSQEKATP